jgi:hypothetical protein
VLLESFLRHRWQSSSRAEPIAMRTASLLRLRARSRSTPGHVRLRCGSLRSWTGPARNASTAAARAMTIASVPSRNAWLLVRDAPSRSAVPREVRQSASAWPADRLEGAASTPSCARNAAKDRTIVLPCALVLMECASSHPAFDRTVVTHERSSGHAPGHLPRPRRRRAQRGCARRARARAHRRRLALDDALGRHWLFAQRIPISAWMPTESVESRSFVRSAGSSQVNDPPRVSFFSGSTPAGGPA